MLSPAYRCSSAFAATGSSNLPEVQTLEQALGLNTFLRKEFLGQLAQVLTDAITQRMQEAGQHAVFAQSFSVVRKAVDKARAERYQRRKLLPVSDPQQAALEKKAKNRRKLAQKKRKVQETIISKRGALGKTRVKQSRSLV